MDKAKEDGIGGEVPVKVGDAVVIITNHVPSGNLSYPYTLSRLNNHGDNDGCKYVKGFCGLKRLQAGNALESQGSLPYV